MQGWRWEGDGWVGEDAGLCGVPSAAYNRESKSECPLASGFLALPFLPMVLGARFIGGQSPGLGG